MLNFLPLIIGGVKTYHSSIAVANYLIEKSIEKDNPLTPMQLIKLVYICHGWMLGINGKPLIKEPVEAWLYGPVVSDLYQKVRKYRSEPVISQLKGGKDTEFDDAEKEFMDDVFDVYGDYTGIQLSSMTHAEGTPWQVTWDRHGKNAIISNDLIEQHYAKLYAEAQEDDK